MNQKVNALLMKMDQFMKLAIKVDITKGMTEYELARKVITIIERENRKLRLVKGDKNA